MGIDERDIKITMRYYRCSRQEAIEALEDGNDEAVCEFEMATYEDRDADFAAQGDWA
ncbi:hypothetical protein IB244_31385 [Rhizobium sp. RHZ02]|uniref:hypothetical protein n=1 Tax=Rhizobium sp. RHZ02 TaxID=2769306 RepID=UPI00177DD3FE|nr:hypothetical protein [Rhizobium sp. RHZ02]MBD9455975.1 hypothetical protein [Rhizobium sp. RHZ02]